ncbi:DUF6602 domain-containing protein [Alkaliphilus oremlandii]|uniref:DUF6602 domain-containing protein n=1 Tax=Alkaliphilus oremlandii (strain OhILAs) TaxID=350688 RepID=A8MHX1_ALKOO|nr:DUF6602 domain-containing protein [Alkaliphilus oremlandii]ABW19403.1 conserved hypothetical protein [Alkaliphilus oremlandii OhILAs]
MSRSNFELYQKSISEEFNALKNRVRNIIGSSHWGEEGRYKEIILMNMLRRVLPKQLSVGTGFVLCSDNQMTKQIDIIIYDNRFPLIFSEGDFIICSNENVVGIIEVKTKVYVRQIEEVIKKAHENGMLIGNHIFNGIFAYDNQFKLMNKDSRSAITLEDTLKRYPGYVNHISLGENFFIRYWNEQEQEENYYSLYYIEKFSFPYFISNLIEQSYCSTADNESNRDKINGIFKYLYSIEHGKETYKFREIEVGND